MTAVLQSLCRAWLAPVSQAFTWSTCLLMLLQSALQLLMALAQPRMLLLLRVKLLYGQSLSRIMTDACVTRSDTIQ